MKTKRCTKCGEVKPIDQFYRNRTTADGRQYTCKACKNRWNRAYRKRPDVMKRQREQTRRIHNDRKYVAMDRIGGARCVLCGCEELLFLTVDHAGGNGHEHRKQLGGSGKSTVIHRWILNATDAELRKWNLRVLCGSCQKATQHYTDDEVRAAIEREHSRIRRAKP